MKSFDLQDVFLLSKAIDKMELRIEADKLAKTVKAEKLENKEDAAALGKDVLMTIGLDIATKFIANLYKADKEVMQLISNISEKNIDAVKTMKLKEIKQFFVDLMESEDVKDFFTQEKTSEK